MTQLHAITRNGTTFGMEVDGRQARRAIKSAVYADYVTPWGTTFKRLCIKAPQIASLMGDAAWIVVEKRDFVEVSFDEDPTRYMVIYPEVAK